ncbi:hypothetical protein [Devosia neptuniae]|jgi:hypothetical protein|uniref:hypothetical protein n=1 Tax=Devosia TaxID=46913 RepID=UPI0022AE754E|nr:hypothetical protein [Devosia neptuniae]MCZ4345765.1 hypothetical protein [Devosia neptuniae]|tara:strand:- start:65954 stop:66490 length:537 start_codon:yes stop_codon:yes gene_type:complete
MAEDYLNDNAQDFAAALGGYVMLTATTEMRFLDLLQLALMSDTGAHIAIWLQFQSTRSRLDMVRHTYRNMFGTNTPETDTLTKLATRFKRLTQQRNFYCHAQYSSDNGALTASGFRITETDEGYTISPKSIDRAAVNELNHLHGQMNDLAEDIEAFTLEMQRHLIEDGRLKGPLLDRS